MKYLTGLSGLVFGASMFALSFVIAAETVLRKFFAFSLGGVDELSGYAVAIVAPLTFLVTAAEQAHIRINLLHAKLPKAVRAVLNAISAITLALLALFLFYFTVGTVADTQAYNSIAQTPWATPLVYPQAVWLVAMGIFAIAAVILAVRAILLLAKRDWTVLDRRYGPGSVDEELQAELDDLHKRQRA